MKKKILKYNEPLEENVSVGEVLDIINQKYGKVNLYECEFFIEWDDYFDEPATLHLEIQREETDEEFNKRCKKSKKKSKPTLEELKKEFGDFNHSNSDIVESFQALYNLKIKSKDDPNYIKNILINAGIINEEGNLTEHYRNEKS
jgi:hypothetical protein